jgi:hypothetical protein
MMISLFLFWISLELEVAATLPGRQTDSAALVRSPRR